MNEEVTISKLGSTTVAVSIVESDVAVTLEAAVAAPQIDIAIVGGADGADGEDGASTTPFEYVQALPAAEWIVNHNLGRRPAGVEVLSPGGLSIIAEVIHMSPNQLRVLFVSPQSGSVVAL